MSSKSASVSAGGSGVSFGGLLALLFIGLKLGGVAPVATWSWVWVLCPLWIGLAFMAVVLGIGLLIALLAAIFGR